MTPVDAEASDRRCGFVAILGAPNAGKSTLVNRLVGQKVTIVTRKVQTTRSRVRGIVIAGSAQLVLIDTPGIFEPRRRLERAMVAAAWSGAADADAVLLLIDAGRGFDADSRRIVAGLKKAGGEAMLALNKIDLVKRPRLLELAAQLDAEGVFSDTFMISATGGDGVDDLKAALAAKAKPGPWYYPEDQLTDVSERLLAAEITREQVFERLHQELPYAIAVASESWKNFRDGSVRVDQMIYVSRQSQKGMVLGKGGRQIKAIGAASRAELERVLGRRVHLFLRVKVRENWIDDPERYREIGLDFPR